MSKKARIVNGKELAKLISAHLKTEFENLNKKLNKKTSIEVFWIGNNASSESFIKIKERYANIFGVDFILKHYKNASEDELKKQISKSGTDALLIQLPLPQNIDTDSVISVITQEKDVDLLKEESFQKFKELKKKELDNSTIPPVAFAVFEIFKHYKINTTDKKLVVLGKGRLVGKPVFELLKKFPHKSLLTFDLNSNTDQLKAALKEADIVISGTGQAHMITPEDIKEGTVLIDAGTSTQKAKGALLGDIDPACEQKASLFARTPGGVGPLTVVGLYRNLLIIAKNKANNKS